MGATSSVDQAQFDALKNTVNAQAGKINALDALKSKVDNLSTAAASGIEYAKLAEAINKENSYRENLAKAIAANPNKLGENLAAEIGKNNSIIETLNSKLASSTTLQDKVADAMSSNEKYKERIRGLKGADGNIGDQSALKSNLFDKGNTLWCADGDVCKLPPGKTGIQIGKWVIQQHPNSNLHIHEGNLEDWSTAVTSKQLHARNGMSIQNGPLFLPNDWRIDTKDNHFRVFDPAQKFVLHKGGDPWLAETGYLKDKFVWKDADYAIKATQPNNDHGWVYLTRHDEWNGHRGKHATYHEGKGAWQRFRFEQY